MLSGSLAALARHEQFHGALSDSFGRQRVILTALDVSTASAPACAVTPSFNWLVALRTVQGLAAGAGMIVSRAVIRDLFPGAEAQKLMAQVAMLAGLGPVIAPVVGSWLHVWFGWRGPFVFLDLLGMALGCACRFGLPEGLPTHYRHPFHPAHLFRAYTQTVRPAALVLL